MARKSRVAKRQNSQSGKESKKHTEPRRPTVAQDDFEAFSDEDEDRVNGIQPTKDDGNEDMLMAEGPSDRDTEESSDVPESHEKDENELELERLVFGDSTGFRNAIADFEEDDEEEGQAHTADNRAAIAANDELFFLDDAPADPQRLLDVKASHGDDDRPPPAWQDSDDERMTVSLMSVPRLRKLRTYEGEDTISGTEYTRRLRQQYETLHPRPAWADWRSDRPSKRRRLSNESSSAASADEVEMDVDTEDDDESPSQAPLAKLLRSAAPLTRLSTSSATPDRPAHLKPEVISVIRHPDIQPVQPHSINSVAIHPTLPLLISAGLSSTMYMHRLDLHPTPPDPPNPLLTSLHLENTPLTTAAFSPGSDSPTDPKIYLSAPRRYFHTWTLPTGNITKTTRIYGEQSTTQQKCTTLLPSPCGRYLALQGTSRKGGGVINILSAASTQWLFQARADGRGGIAAFAWWADGGGLSIVAKTGEVTEFSTATRAIVCRWADPGAVGVTTLALGADPDAPYFRAKKKARAQARASLPDGTYIGPDRHVALGLNSGIVLIYDRRAITAGNDAGGASRAPDPLRTLTQLTTPISSLTMSPCGQVLVMASRWKKDALRLVHLPSAAVYRNWPTAKTPLGRVASVVLGEVALGDRTVRVLVVGGENGSLRMWEVGT